MAKSLAEDRGFIQQAYQLKMVQHHIEDFAVGIFTSIRSISKSQ